MIEKWCTQPDSNGRPLPSEGVARPRLLRRSSSVHANNDGTRRLCAVEAHTLPHTQGDHHRLTDEQLATARQTCKSTPRTTYKRTVYFAAAENGPIKIGATSDVRRRLRELRTKSKQDLKLLAVADGGTFAECMCQHRFAAHRLHGEWFARHPDILAEIARLTDTEANHG